MKTFLTLLVTTSLFLSTVKADETLTITKSGYYLTVQDSKGVPTYVQIKTVVDLRDNHDKTPDTPTTPVPPTDPLVYPDLVDQIKEWSSTIDDPQSAQAIASTYAHVYGALNDNTLSPENVWVPLKQSTDSALGVIVDSKDWSDFRIKLTKIFTEAQQRGRLTTAEQIKKMLLTVQKGLESSAVNTELSMDQIVEIARRTNLAIDGVTK